MKYINWFEKLLYAVVYGVSFCLTMIVYLVFLTMIVYPVFLTVIVYLVFLIITGPRVGWLLALAGVVYAGLCLAERCW